MSSRVNFSIEINTQYSSPRRRDDSNNKKRIELTDLFYGVDLGRIFFARSPKLSV